MTKINVQAYRVFVEPLIESLGGGYVAHVPSLPGCLSDGETPDEALRNVYDAIGCWIEAAQVAGQEVPPPELARQYA